MNEWEWRLLEERPAVDGIPHHGGELRAGSRVRLRAIARASDAMDMLLVGKTAVVEAIEQDYEGSIHLALVFDDDPGRDLGLLRQPGHRFFYAPDDVELLPPEDPTQDTSDQPAVEPAADPLAPGAGQVATILIAGIGNIFLGDDGFGVEVARRLSTVTLPNDVRVIDYGIRSLDLAYALMDGPDVTILVDACPRGEPPGTLFVLEPDLAVDTVAEPFVPDAHSMNPLLVIRMAQSMGGPLKRVLLVGCEPATLGPDEGQLGLSDEVEAAVDQAVTLVQGLVRDIRKGDAPADHRQPGA